MKSYRDRVLKSLSFRTIVPTVVIALLSWAGLYVFVLRSVSHFADAQIREAFVEMGRDIYAVCDRYFHDLLRTGSPDDGKAARMRKATSISMIDDFMRQNRLKGAITHKGDYLLLTEATGEELITASREREGTSVVSTFRYKDLSYYAFHIRFEPWGWDITLIKDSVEYLSLIRQVRLAYAVTGMVLFSTTVLFIYTLRRNIRRPLDRILVPIKQGLKPNYHGITEFEYLSDSVRAALTLYEKETLALNNLYHIAVVKRGEEFFDEAAMAISRLFRLHAAIARLTPDGKSAHIISLHENGNITRNIDIPLRGTPLEDVVANNNICVISFGVHRQFPEVRLFADTRAESFIGLAIFNRKGVAIGFISAFGGEREFTESDIKALQTIGEMVASEVERLDEEKNKERMQEQLFQAQKMEAVGTLAGGIAHDFNNMLQGILGHASLIKAQIRQDHAFFSSVDTIEHIAERAAQLTSQLLGFARKGKYVVEQININTLIDNVLKIISQTFDRSIEIKTALGKDVIAMRGDKSQIEQVIMNLCLNARDAMQHGGTLTIETFNTSALSHGLPGSSLPHYGNQVAMRISDTGAGIPDDVKEHIFEPFFTTKGIGKGTGMGLAMVYGVVKNHSGSITVESRVNEGSSFTVLFPSSPQKSADEKGPAAPALAYGRGTILVVDDEEFIRNVLRNMLEQLGYKVFLAANGKEAIEIYAGIREQIDLVILDLMMPVMNGHEAYERLMQINSKVKVLIASGHSTEDPSPVFAGQDNQAFIQKPFRMQDVASKIKSMLEA